MSVCVSPVQIRRAGQGTKQAGYNIQAWPLSVGWLRTSVVRAAGEEGKGIGVGGGGEGILQNKLSGQT